MITRRTNTYASRVYFSSHDVIIDGHIIFRSRAPYFRYLWARRDQWVPCSLLMEAAGAASQSLAMDTLQRLAVELEDFEGFKLERKREAVFFEEPNPPQVMYHWYYRLTTPDALPKPSSPNEALRQGRDLCPSDGKPCYEARDPDEAHWRCGTEQCGKHRTKGC